MSRRMCMMALCVGAALLAAGFETAIYEAVDLRGAWEMAYDAHWPDHATPNASDTEMPRFSGVRIAQAIPAYWEDLPQFAQHALPFTPEKFPFRKSMHTHVPGQIRGQFYYRRTVDLATVRAGAYLAFELVRNNVRVWVNGRFVGRHCGYLTSFEMPIADGVLVRGRNEIVLAVDNADVPGLDAAHPAVGGTTTRAIFLHTGGIDGRCELRFAKSALKDVYVTTAADLRTFTVHVAGGEEFAWRILDGSRTLREGRARGDFTQPTEGLAFWSPESPKRYHLELAAKGGTARVPFGLRRLVARGEKLFLNGEPVYLRGICDHCYYARTMHLPFDLDYYRKVVNFRKACGFNYVRFHTYVPPEPFFEAMDELGYLMHVETPHCLTPEAYAEVVAFARRHPCAVMYCSGNEDNPFPALEAALPRYAEAVHTMTDALFSPICALRGVEYMLNKTELVKRQPFPHNPARMARYAAFSDLFTSYQLGMTSYNSLDGGSWQKLDQMGDAYCGKPRLSHETCIDGTYLDFSTEKLYPPDSPYLRAGIFAGLRRQLARKGLMDRADTYFRNSSEWMWRIRKHCFEKLRAARRMQGFDFLGDINTHWYTLEYSVGICDEFYRMKPGESVENLLRYNAPAVIVCDLGSHFVFSAGTKRCVRFTLSNYAATATGGTLNLSLETEDGTVVAACSRRLGALPKGDVREVAAWDVAFPDAPVPRKYWLRAALAAGTFRAENRWETYAFPKPEKVEAPGVKVLSGKVTKANLLAELAAGRRVVLFGAGPFKSLPTSYRIGLAGRSAGNYATVIRPHPALADLPHEGFCGWQFRDMMHWGQAIQLEGDVPFNPIVDVASSVKVVIRQSLLFEYRVGRGRLLVCGFKFSPSDPAAQWLRARLLAYAAGPAFEPAEAITPEQLAAVCDAPLVTGSVDTNQANDTHGN